MTAMKKSITVNMLAVAMAEMLQLQKECFVFHETLCTILQFLLLLVLYIYSMHRY